MKARMQNKNLKFQSSWITHDVGQADLLLLACVCKVPLLWCEAHLQGEKPHMRKMSDTTPRDGAVQRYETEQYRVLTASRICTRNGNAANVFRRMYSQNFGGGLHPRRVQIYLVKDDPTPHPRRR